MPAMWPGNRRMLLPARGWPLSIRPRPTRGGSSVGRESALGWQEAAARAAYSLTSHQKKPIGGRV